VRSVCWSSASWLRKGLMLGYSTATVTTEVTAIPGCSARPRRPPSCTRSGDDVAEERG
jgi:hypothetical protein